MDKQKSLQTIMAELSELEGWFKSDEVTIDGALEKYQKGMDLIAQAKEHMEDVENQFTQVASKFESVESDE